jgi:hypothetical protein
MATKRKHRKPVVIGARWTPGQRSARGSDGSFESVNEYDFSRDATLLQRALLRPVEMNVSWPGAGLLAYLVIAAVAAGAAAVQWVTT